MNSIPKYTALQISKFFIVKAKESNIKITPLKVNKLVYISQGIYLVLSDGNRLFDDKIKAWQYGPVISDVFYFYRTFGNADLSVSYVTEIDEELSSDMETLSFLDNVWDSYKNLSDSQLSKWSNEEGSPWYTTIDHSNYSKDIQIDTLKKYFSACIEILN